MGSGRAGLSRRGRDALQQDARHLRRAGGAPTRFAAPAARYRRADDARGRGGTLYDHVQPCIALPPRRRPRGTRRSAPGPGGTVCAGCHLRRPGRDPGRRTKVIRVPPANSAGCRLRAGRCGVRAARRMNPPVEPNVDAASRNRRARPAGPQPAATAAPTAPPPLPQLPTEQSAVGKTGGDGRADRSSPASTVAPPSSPPSANRRRRSRRPLPAPRNGRTAASAGLRSRHGGRRGADPPRNGRTAASSGLLS